MGGSDGKTIGILSFSHPRITDRLLLSNSLLPSNQSRLLISFDSEFDLESHSDLGISLLQIIVSPPLKLMRYSFLLFVLTIVMTLPYCAAALAETFALPPCPGIGPFLSH